MLIPFVWMASTSVKTKSEITFEGAGWLPKRWRWDNFAEVFRRTNFSFVYWNSAFVTLLVTSGQVATSAMAGFAFSRLDWPGRDKPRCWERVMSAFLKLEPSSCGAA